MTTLARIVEIPNPPWGRPVTKSILGISKIVSVLAVLSISGCVSTPNGSSTSVHTGPGSLHEKGEKKVSVTNYLIPPYGASYWYSPPR